MVALTTGGRTETFAMQTLRAERPGLPAACFVQMGDFLRYALDEVVAQGLPEVVLGVMVGKLTKIAQGETITHANRNVVDTDLVAEIARQIGATDEDRAAIAAAETARFGAELMVERGLGPAFHQALAQRAIDTLTAPERYGHAFALRVLVCDFSGKLVADVRSAPVEARPRPATAGRTGIGHTHHFDFRHRMNDLPLPRSQPLPRHRRARRRRGQPRRHRAGPPAHGRRGDWRARARWRRSATHSSPAPSPTT